MKKAAPTSSVALLGPRQFSLRELMFLILIVSVLLAIGVWFRSQLRGARREAERITCAGKLKQIGLALLTYHDHWHSFPPATTTDAGGKPLHSWRVLILQQCEQQPLYDQYDMSEPWNGPKNSRLHEIEPVIWKCSDESSRAAGMTNFVAITGAGTPWPAPNRSSRTSDFQKEKRSSIMVVEIRNSDIHWMEPRDLDIRTLKFAINSDAKNSISSRHFNGAIVVSVDGTVEYLSNQETEARLRKMVLIADENMDGAGKVQK